MQINSAADQQSPLFYIADWLPPDFGAVGQYALISSQQRAATGREIYLIGLTRGPASKEIVSFKDGANGVLTIQKLQAKPYEKTRFFRRLLWTLSTNLRLCWAVFRHPKSHGAEIQFTGAPPFMLYFAIALKYLRGAHLTYRITDFYPEAIILLTWADATPACPAGTLHLVSPKEGRSI